MQLVSIKEFSTIKGVSNQYLYMLIKRNRIPSEVMAGLRVIDLDNPKIKDYLKK